MPSNASEPTIMQADGAQSPTDLGPLDVPRTVNVPSAVNVPSTVNGNGVPVVRLAKELSVDA